MRRETEISLTSPIALWINGVRREQLQIRHQLYQISELDELRLAFECVSEDEAVGPPSANITLCIRLDDAEQMANDMLKLIAELHEHKARNT